MGDGGLELGAIAGDAIDSDSMVHPLVSVGSAFTLIVLSLVFWIISMAPKAFLRAHPPTRPADPYTMTITEKLLRRR